MVRKYGAMWVALLIGASVLLGAGPAQAETPSPDPFAETCDDTPIDDVDLPAVCIDDQWVSSDPFGDDIGESGDDFGAIVAVMVFLGLFAAGVGIWWRVSMAQRLARGAGMDEGDAASMAAFTDGGLEATYLASQLRPTASQPAAPPAPPAGSATRLAELKGLLDAAAITQEEYDDQRRRIIEGI